MPTPTTGASEKIACFPLDRGQQYIDPTHPDFGAPVDGATDATAAIQDACTNANGAVVVLPARASAFVTTGFNLGTAKGLVNLSVLKTVTDAPVISLSANDQFVHHGKIQGVSGGVNSQTGVDINGLLNFDIEDVLFYNLIKGARAQNTSGAYKGGRVTHCAAQSCTTGFHADTIGEYVTFSECDGVGCVSAFAIRGGNVSLVACKGNDSTNGIYLQSGSNDSHGSATGCHFNHNSSYAVLTDAVTLGFDFVGCHFYGGEIYLNGGQDINFIGGIASIVNWRLAASARGRAVGMQVNVANGDGYITDVGSYFQFLECFRPGGVGLPLARIKRGGYVTAGAPGADQNIPNAATTQLTWIPATQETQSNSSQTAYSFLHATNGTFTNRGLGNGHVDVRLTAKLLNPGAAPTNAWMNVKKNGTIIHGLIPLGRINTGGVEYAVWQWNSRIQMDVSDTLTFEVANNTGSAMTFKNSDSTIVVEGL